MTWYRTHRPQTVAELALPSVREQFERLMQTGQYAHAYLFAGPRGLGKTSSARILARILNDPRNRDAVLAGKGPLVEPDGDDPLLQKIAQGRSQVVIEQDAASNRGIDDIRQLQEYLSTVPTEGLVRVVILDEVHMLSNEAFNALLKVLEEPPAQVVFVLATTELHKIPATIQSRCQVFQFRPATAVEIQAVLQQVAEREGVTLPSEVAQQISQLADGGFRDAIKYLEQVVRDKQVDPALVEAILGSQTRAEDLLRVLAQRDVLRASALLVEARAQGVSMSQLQMAVLRALQARLHRAIERQEKPQSIRHMTELLAFLIASVNGPEPIEGIRFETACLAWCTQDVPSESDAKTSPPPSKPPTSKPTTPEAPLMAARKEQEETSVISSAPVAELAIEVPILPVSSSAEAVSLALSDLRTQWGTLLLAMRTESAAIESVLRAAELLSVEGTSIQLAVPSQFHKERLETAKYSEILHRVLSTRLQTPVQIQISVHHVADDQPAQVSQQATEDSLLAAVEDALM